MCREQSCQRNGTCRNVQFKDASSHPICFTLCYFIRVYFCASVKPNIWVQYCVEPFCFKLLVDRLTIKTDSYKRLRLLLSVDGMWGSWTEWSACSVTCGDGSQTRDRECDNPERAFGGEDCDGDDEETRDCNDAACPMDGDDDNGATQGPAASARSGSGKEASKQPITCTVFGSLFRLNIITLCKLIIRNNI